MNPRRALALTTLISALAPAAAHPRAADAVRGRQVVDQLLSRACARLSSELSRPSVFPGQAPLDPAFARQLRLSCALRDRRAARPAIAPTVVPASTGAFLPDGTVVQRQRLSRVNGIAMDLVAYASTGITVGGLLCYPDDGQRRSAVIHIHGGLGGIFDDPEQSMVKTCVDWAQAHDRVAFAPSLRGQDGGEGRPELCLGEADDVASAATFLRSLDIVDPARLAVVGGSIGGCVALRGAAKIPDLRAVVAYVPPLDWKGLVQYHRTQWQPAVETRCDGTTYDWNVGGTALADVFDNMICGHPGCADAEYLARSPLNDVLTQSAPTLIASASLDNVVPFDQELLWSLLRQRAGHEVSVDFVDRCAPPHTPFSRMDVLLYVPRAYHLLSDSAISSGLLFLMQELDLPAPAAARP
jgi:acetyl esterase/lipase